MSAPIPLVRYRSESRCVTDQFQPELAADGSSSALKGVQCNARIGGIEQTVERSAAGLHADGHGRLGEAVLLHGGFDLISEDLFDGLFLALFQNALFGQKVVKRRPNPALLLTRHSEHLLHTFEHEPQILTGVFCVFLTKPCSSTMRSRVTQKITRPIFPSVRSLRTSHRPSPRLRQ